MDYHKWSCLTYSKQNKAETRAESPLVNFFFSLAITASHSQFIRQPNPTIVNFKQEIYQRWDSVVAEEDFAYLEEALAFIAEQKPQSARQFSQAVNKANRLNPVGRSLGKAELLHVYNRLAARQAVTENMANLRPFLVKKSGKSQSGVLVITVMTSPYPEVDGVKQSFSCEWNCYYCPNEPGQPRSYLHDEPSVLRGNHNGFDPVLQFTER